METKSMEDTTWLAKLTEEEFELMRKRIKILAKDSVEIMKEMMEMR